ncbi:MAG: DUF421 domain-containing protein [Clostridia bacterium]|nr:DUF421 domain-containing protein [Clostridia bacterium]MBQ7012260.1 DUF421 domain-containing protein [Clostridia bacterium]
MQILNSVIKAFAIYFGLMIAMKLLGKRQAGEMRLSELITTLLISELATAPILERELPVHIPISALITILLLEFITSFLALKIPFVRELVEGKPSALINRGRLDKKELRRARMSVDELLSEMRLQGISEPEDIYCATLESNGKMSFILKSDARPLTFSDLHLPCEEKGVAHAVITAGRVDHAELKACGRNEQWLSNLLKEKNAALSDVLLCTVTDGGQVYITVESK